MGQVKRRNNYSVRLKLIVVFIATSVVVSGINMFMYMNVKQAISKIDTVYNSNESLNELSGSLENVQSNVYRYLNTKNSEALEEYYRYEQEYSELTKHLERKVMDNATTLMEKNIYQMSRTYLEKTNDTVSAKRASNISKYKETYEETDVLYERIDVLIRSLNNIQFQENSKRYSVLRTSLNYLLVTSIIVLILLFILNSFFVFFMTRSITSPFVTLAYAANQVASGNFHIEVPYSNTQDELGVLSRAFNKMIVSIGDYIHKTKEHYERENKLKENQLIMKNDLKDAQLKYLQAQINPHFLFNTLNAGAQLAMMEGAERTCLFVENMADFFRYNVQKVSTDASIAEEVELVDNYVHILNVRFSGEICFEKCVDESLLNYRIPSMILQPIVENAVNHGIRGLEREGKIWLSIYKYADKIGISVADNGHGISEEIKRKILHGERVHSVEEKDSTGIGMDNVISRLRRYFDVEDVIEIESKGNGKGTKITLCLPIIVESGEI